MFELDLKTDPNGLPRLHFDTIFISDIHFGTKHCKAKLLYQFLNHIQTPEMHLVGDIIDGWYMSGKATYNLGPFHRQSMAEFIRIANSGTRVIYEPGNHDETLRGKTLKSGQRHRQMTGKSLFGIAIKDHDIYTDKNGRRFYVVHGDEFDPDIYKSEKGLAYKAGDLVISSLGDFDCWAEKTFSKEFRVAATAKRAFKAIEEGVMPNLKNAEQKALSGQFDGVVFGHSHLRGFKKSKSGVVLINDGCSTDDGIEFAAVDKSGNWAIIKWLKEGIKVNPENGKEILYKWADLSLDGKITKPEPREDWATYSVDRLQRILYRLWPPTERKKALEEKQAERPLPIPLENPKLSKPSL
jgi:UDP-2,3-diacylglucosamine pyrophosphatase LpxH